MSGIGTCVESFENCGPNSAHHLLSGKLAMSTIADMQEVGQDLLTLRTVLLTAIQLAGAGQLLLCVSSLAIPFLLEWEKEFVNVKPLLRQMFLVYAGYILSINFCFGLLSVFSPESIVEVAFLPAVVAAFMFVYWLARVMVEMFVFDLNFLNRPHELVGRRGIEILFAYLTVVYGTAFIHDLGLIPLDHSVPDLGSFGRMVAIILVFFTVIKICVTSMPLSHGPRMSRFSTLIFFVVWPGMRPSSLLERKALGSLTWLRDVTWGSFFLVLGFVWSIGVKLGHDAGLSNRSLGLMALPGISMIGHFGVLRLLRACLRFVGFDVELLFTDPLYADSMSDFWGKRWNVAFSDFNRYVIVAAVKTALEEDLGMSKTTAAQIGIFAAFVASAILHELAITVPVRAGYGGPSLYFAIQGFGVILEKQVLIATWRGRFPILARAVMWIGILLPFPLCFVQPFCSEIALPLTLFVGNIPSHVLSVVSNLGS
eukprot:TRINITY_DN75016_c0_g1_i1.p1 TRINITY_DN75016_c0_g1~~TRINITY_DN75016_c0_g1_i1.p1  ORF type:complete len:483 (-),score=53.33 TRINITY_DN75016_c0_g1_i1:23-1471(-)